MISVKKCKEYLEGADLTDQEIIEIRDILYAVAGQIFDADISGVARHDEKAYEE